MNVSGNTTGSTFQTIKTNPASKMIAIILLVGFVFIVWKVLPVVLPLVFTIYLVYGFIRPRLSRKIVREIEDEEEEENSPPAL